MKKCEGCGTEFSDDAELCPSCGKPADDGALVADDAADMDGTDNAPPARAEPVVFSSGGTQVNNAIPPKIESHLVKAIISTFCCCIPFGVVAIVYAAQVGPNLRANNFDAALEAGKKAGLWSNLAIGMGIILQLLWLCFYKFIFNEAFIEILRANING